MTPRLTAITIMAMSLAACEDPPSSSSTYGGPSPTAPSTEFRPPPLALPGPSDTEAPSNQPPLSNSAATVTVQVTSAGRPVSGAFVAGVHHTAKTLIPLGREHAYTDVNGRYEFRNVLPGTVYLMAEKESYLRPCMAASAVDGNTNLELELVTPTALRPLKPTAPTLTGVVYDGQMRPAAAATVSAFWLEEMPEFFTKTDEKGRYLLCGLPDDFFRRGVIRAFASRREAVHYFHDDGHFADQGNEQFVLDLYLKPFSLQ